LKKLDAGEVDATVLAAAGVRRLGMEARISEHLDEETMLPAVGQGALCVEIRRDDPLIGPLAAALDHADSRLAVTAERAFLHRLEGSCQVPVAGRARIDGDTLTLTGLVAELDGSTVFKDVETGPLDDPALLGRRLADRLIERGAGEVLARLKASAHVI
jgi:hydroxymethylbilane synthase